MSSQLAALNQWVEEVARLMTVTLCAAADATYRLDAEIGRTMFGLASALRLSM